MEYQNVLLTVSIDEKSFYFKFAKS